MEWTPKKTRVGLAKKKSRDEPAAKNLILNSSRFQKWAILLLSTFSDVRYNIDGPSWLPCCLKFKICNIHLIVGSNKPQHRPVSKNRSQTFLNCSLDGQFGFGQALSPSDPPSPPRRKGGGWPSKKILL